MAEGKFPLEVEVTVDWSRFREEVRAELAALSRGGVTIPIRPGAAAVGGGAPGSVGTSVAIAEQAAVQQAMAQAQVQSNARFASGGAPGGSALMQSLYAAGGSFGGGGGITPPPAAAPFPDGLSSPNWSYLLSQGTGGTGSQAAPMRARVPGTRGQLPTSTFRGLFSLFAVTELGSSLQSVRQGDSAANLAATPEESLLARARGVEQGSSGLFGSAVAFLPNLLDLQGSPQRLMREAQEAVTLSQFREGARRQQFSTAADVAFREGYGQGGTTQGNIERARIEALDRSDQIKARISNLQARLGEQSYREITPALSRLDYTLRGDARTTAQTQLREEQSALENNTANLQLAEAQARQGRDAFQLNAAQTAQRTAAIRRGAGPRELVRLAIRQQFDARAVGDVEQFGAEGFQSNRTELYQELGAYDAGNALDDRQRFGRQLAGSAVAGFQRIGQTIDSLRLFQRRAGFQQLQLGQALSGDPEGSAISGVRGNTDEQIQATRFLPWGVRQLAQNAISRSGELQQDVVRRQFAVRRFEAGEELEGATRQSRFRELGGDYEVDATLDRIRTDTSRDAREFQRQGEGRLAQQRRNLGVQQIRESRADYFRSISFEEVSGGRIAAGRGNPFDDVEKKFRDAEAGIGKDAAGKKGPGGGDEVPVLIRSFMEMVRPFLERNFRARAS